MLFHGSTPFPQNHLQAVPEAQPAFWETFSAPFSVS
jgi:hypothetical protein